MINELSPAQPEHGCNEKWPTHAGNIPLHLAIYSLPTEPLKNSCVSSLAREGDVGRIIKPDVSLSSLFTAVKVKEVRITATSTY